MKTVFTFFIIIFFPFLSFAVATYTGPSPLTTIEYNNPANWSGGTVPGGAELIIFNTPVTIAANLPISSSNAIRVISPGSLTINSGVTLNSSDVDIRGAAIINNGVWNAHNIGYSNIANGSFTNNGTLNGANLNIGSGTLAGSFTNNGNMVFSANILVEEGTFDNNPGGIITSNGLAIRSGATLLNGGTLTSTATGSTGQLDVDAGGTLVNEAGGVLNSRMTVGNVYAMNINGSFTNQGTVNVGTDPFNTGSQGIKAGTGGSFVNSASIVFEIDPTNCVLVNNTGVNGTFSPGTVTIISGSNCLSTPLPVILEDFSFKVKDCNTTLNWTTAEETRFTHFDVQWSENGVDFKIIGTLKAKGQGSSYQFLNDKYKAAINYYRLQMVDINGNSDYSATLMVKGCSGTTTSCYPNPVFETLTVEGINTGSIIQLTNALGQSIITRPAYGSFEKIKMSGLPHGVYAVRIIDNKAGLNTVFKIIKQ